MRSMAIGVFGLLSLLRGHGALPAHVLTTSRIIHVCGTHPGEHYSSIAVRGYFVPRVVSIERKKGGEGGLYVRRRKQPFIQQGDATPFVEVHWLGRADNWIPSERVVVRGSLSCVALSPGDFPAIAAEMIAHSWTKAP